MWRNKDNVPKQVAENPVQFQTMKNQPVAENADLEELLGLRDNSQQVGLMEILYLIRERWITGVLVGLLLASLAVFVIMRQPKSYESHIQFTIEGQDRAINQIFESQGKDRELATHVTKVESQNFLNALASEIAANQAFASNLGTDPNTIVATLNRSLSARQVDSSFVRVNIRHSNPEVAALIANEVGRYYKVFAEQQKVDDLSGERQTLESELLQSQQRLKQINEELLKVGQAAGDKEVDLQAEKLRSLNDQLPALENEIQEKRVALDEIAVADLKTKLDRQEFAGNQAVQDAFMKFQTAEENKLAGINEGLGTLHPAIRAAEAEINRSKRILDNAINTAVVNLQASLTASEKNYERVKSEIASISSQIESRGQHVGTYAELKAQRDIILEQIKSHNDSLSNIRLRTGAGITTLTVLDEAQPNYSPVTPDKRLAALAGLGLFGLCFVGLPIVLGLLDNRLNSISEVEKFLGVDCLATIPAKKENELDDLGLAVMTGGDEAVVESFRVLYSSLRMSSNNDFPITMLITSSAPAEGKSFVTTNLGAFFAEQGKRTLIVDCDFRKPTQHRNVKKTNDQGVIRWFHSDEPVPQDPDEFGDSQTLGFLALGESENLFLLRAGGTSKSPTSMIESNRFAQLVHSLRAYFDVIIFDTPPVGLFPDALFVSDYTDESIFVTKFKELNRQKIKFALNQLHKADANVLGVVVNYLTTRSSFGYGYGYSDYGYGHYSSKDYARYYSTNDS